MAKAKKEPKANKPETVAQIRAKAAKIRPDPAKFARAQRRSDAAQRSERFEWNRSKSTVDGILIHYFRIRGESITGILCAPDYESFKGLTYKLLLDDDTITRLPGNRQLNRVIKDADCLYQRVTITYLGKRWLTTRHYEKVYAISQAPLGKAGVGPKGRKLLEQVAEEAKARKAGSDEL
jgi:hypothetical protein